MSYNTTCDCNNCAICHVFCYVCWGKRCENKCRSHDDVNCSTMIAPFPSTREPNTQHPGCAHPLNPHPQRLKEFSTAVSFQLNSHCYFSPPGSTHFHTEITSYIMESCTYPVKNMTAWQQDLQCKKCWIKQWFQSFILKQEKHVLKGILLLQKQKTGIRVHGLSNNQAEFS